MMKIKDKLPAVLGFVSFILVFGFVYYLFVYQATHYYTRIDNTKVEHLSSTDDMKYEYHLVCYNDEGKPKKIKFKTSRKLKEGAYIQLEFMLTRGVKEWWEVQFDDLPVKVQEKWKVLY